MTCNAAPSCWTFGLAIALLATTAARAVSEAGGPGDVQGGPPFGLEVFLLGPCWSNALATWSISRRSWGRVLPSRTSSIDFKKPMWTHAHVIHRVSNRKGRAGNKGGRRCHAPWASSIKSAAPHDPTMFLGPP